LLARTTDLKPEENPNGNKTEKEEKKRIYPKGGKKTETEENNNFKSADSPQFQTAAVTPPHPRVNRQS
jgi:hypothetical protein